MIANKIISQNIKNLHNKIQLESSLISPDIDLIEKTVDEMQYYQEAIEEIEYMEKQIKSSTAELMDISRLVCGTNEDECVYDSVERRIKKMHDETSFLKERRESCCPTCFHHQTHPCEKCGRINGYLPSVWYCLIGKEDVSNNNVLSRCVEQIKILFSNITELKVETEYEVSRNFKPYTVIRVSIQSDSLIRKIEYNQWIEWFVQNVSDEQRLEIVLDLNRV